MTEGYKINHVVFLDGTKEILVGNYPYLNEICFYNWIGICTKKTLDHNIIGKWIIKWK
jgi:hypothetical protein